MKDELDDDDGKGALIIGIGGPKDELGGGHELEPLMASFARAIKQGNFGKASRIFAEAVEVCADHDEDDDSYGGKSSSSDDDDDDYLS